MCLNATMRRNGMQISWNMKALSWLKLQDKTRAFSDYAMLAQTLLKAVDSSDTWK